LFGATAAFTNGVVENLPHASKRMLYIRLVFLLIPIYFWARMLFLPMLFDMSIVLFPGILEGAFTLYVMVMSIMSIAAGVMIVEVDSLMQIVLCRMNFLDHIKNAEPKNYSEYASAPERLVRFLSDSDPCYGQAKAAKGRFILQHSSDECLVLAITTPTPPSLEMVKGFWKDAKDYVKKQSFVPNKARFIILYTPEGDGEELPDEAARFILENPVRLGQGPGYAKSETVIQVIIEERGTYSFLPFVE
ncbi:hypothetical protein, partial [Methanocalculus sp.]|uniref:hypothetical protein n=1 Tax=Methanocalculus sp. TaxID=2004547 RepID=UPI0026340A76